jgi:hypothetical protein
VAVEGKHMKVPDICLVRVRVERVAGGRCLWLPDDWRKGGRECGFVAGQFDELTYADGGSPSLERSRVEE